MSKMFQYPFAPIHYFGEPRDFTGDNILGPYTAETVQRFVHGTRFLLWDGRVLKYALTGAEVESYHGVCATEAAPLSYTAAGVAASAGDLSVSLTLISRSEDDLAGGYVALYDGTDIDTSSMRGIVGNDASGATYTKIYVDFPLHLPIVATTDAFEAFENPYGAVSEVSNAYSAWVGVPCVSAASGYNIWIQTWGPAFISPGNQTLDDPVADERGVMWQSNAVIAEIVSGTSADHQYAGYILNQGTGIAGPIIQLMCST